MHQADAVRLNPDVAAIPMSQREAIWKAMEGRNDLANLASENPDMVMPEPVRQAMQQHVYQGMPAMPTITDLKRYGWVSAVCWNRTGPFLSIPRTQSSSPAVCNKDFIP